MKLIGSLTSPYVRKVRIVMVELHDRYRPGCDKAFYDATTGFQPGITHVQTVMRLQAVPAV